VAEARVDLSGRATGRPPRRRHGDAPEGTGADAADGAL